MTTRRPSIVVLSDIIQQYVGSDFDTIVEASQNLEQLLAATVGLDLEVDLSAQGYPQTTLGELLEALASDTADNVEAANTLSEINEAISSNSASVLNLTNSFNILQQQVVASKAYLGGYNAATNTPDLVTPALGEVLQGYAYDVTSGGTAFFGQTLTVGDTVRSTKDNPSVLGDWVIIPQTLNAASIKVQYESNADTNEFSDAEKTKLGTIEANATGDQTGAEIKALYEVETKAWTDSLFDKLNDIESDAKDDQNADEVPYDNSGSGLVATNVETAIDEVEFRVELLEIEPDQTAAETSYDNATSGLTANDTQAAIDELDGRLDPVETKLSTIEDNADVTDATSVDAAGAVMETDISTVNMSFVIDDDTMASATDTNVPTSESVVEYVNTTIAAEIVGANNYKGGYNAASNVPDLESPSAGVVKSGHVWDVTAPGFFFTTEVETGDTIRAKVDNPSSVSDWVILQLNLSPSSIKVQYESNADTNAYTDSEKTKLAGVELNATGDQTGAEIAAALFSEPNTNNFDDAAQTKLAGIATGATDDQTGAEIKALYEAEANTNAFTDAAQSKLSGIEANATQDQSDAEIKTAYENNADTNAFTDANQTKLLGIEPGAEVNNISDVNATDLTDAGESSLHYHDSDRARTNHTGTQTAATISDFDIEVGNQTDVAANTAHRTSTGADHSFINQDVTIGSAPNLDGANFTGVDKTVFETQIVGSTADPDTTANTSGTAAVIAEMTYTFTPASASSFIEVDFSSLFDKTGGGDDQVFAGIFIDDVLQAGTVVGDFVSASDDYDTNLATFWKGSLSAVSHTITVKFWISDDTAIAKGTNRQMTIKETELAA